MGPIRVLLVDDEAEFRTVMRAALDDDGRFQVVDEAADGHQAVALAAFHQPDLVLLDLMMPELDGLQAAAKIREEAPAALIVMLSSRESRTAAAPAVESGAHAFIEKHEMAGAPDRLIDLLQAHRL